MNFKTVFLFLSALLLLSCGSDSTSESFGLYSTKFTVDGEQFFVEYNEDNNVLLSATNTDLKGVDNCFVYHSSAILTPSLSNFITIRFTNLGVEKNCDDALNFYVSNFNSLFTPGSKLYDSNTNYLMLNTIGITFDDENGNSWSTWHGEQQDDSSFEITAVEDLEASEAPLSIKKISGTFNCTVYREGNTKKITDGRFELYVTNEG
ncbi:MAG: hypothetical protein P1U56_20625 [Saprospiraceae bacterium]|nr:hypothetical protein [Saprospiraceae bacterium]